MKTKLKPSIIARVTRLMVIAGLITTSACSPTSFVDIAKPSSVVDNAWLDSKEGAVALHAGTLGLWAMAYQAYIEATGLMTDELHITTYNGRSYRVYQAARSEFGPWQNDNNAGSETMYIPLHKTRVQASQAASYLMQLSSGDSTLKPMAARMWAIQGYSELLLAEAFCNGILLSDIPVGGGTVMHSQRLYVDSVFKLAAANFTRAIAEAGFDSSTLNLARVGLGRALLHQGDFSGARSAVKDVPTSYVYNVNYTTAVFEQRNHMSYATIESQMYVLDNEGGNGLAWRESGDPRIKITLKGSNYVPDVYANGNTPVRLASGTEARLIEAEAMLQNGEDGWLTVLNQLRATGGTGAGGRIMPDTIDPGTVDGRIDLLFYERAFWLYLRGYRQGDLRRLVRQYGRMVSTTYPIGPFTPTTTRFPTFYGEEAVMPIPASEARNPNFGDGCLDTDA